MSVVQFVLILDELELIFHPLTRKQQEEQQWLLSFIATGLLFHLFIYLFKFSLFALLQHTFVTWRRYQVLALMSNQALHNRVSAFESNEDWSTFKFVFYSLGGVCLSEVIGPSTLTHISCRCWIILNFGNGAIYTEITDLQEKILKSGYSLTADWGFHANCF